MASEKQLLANQQNALKSTGPKTTEGKARAKRNSLKHGLLAKEVVITEGVGAEDQQAFDAVLTNFVDHYKPMGPLEEMLVEKIAVCYWRQRRAHRYEVGVVQEQLIKQDFKNYYESQTNPMDFDSKIQWTGQAVNVSLELNEMLKEVMPEGKNLSLTYPWKGCWEWIEYQFITCQIKNIEDAKIGSREEELVPKKANSEHSSKEIHKSLNLLGFSNLTIARAIDHINNLAYTNNCEALKNNLYAKETCVAFDEAIEKKCVLPPKLEMDNLLRYETAIERQFYKAINQLERLQRMRLGDHVPAPIQVDVNTSGPGGLKLV